jgi:capsular exopolysaccharide synthesis family protein
VATQIASKNTISRELNLLPIQEVQLGRLQRKQQVISDVYTAVLERYNKAKVADAVEIADFYIMDAAVPPLPPPLDRSESFLIALLIGLVLPAAALIIRSRATGAVYTKTALNDTFGLPVLEAVPKFRVPHNGAKKTAVPRIDAGCKPTFIPELFDSMFMKLRLRWAENPDAKVVAITGLETGGGKSTIALNLAIKIAELGNTVLLVDTDLHRGKIHDQFDFPLSPGLTDALKAQEESLIGGPLAPINATGIPGLSVVPAGEEIDNPFNTLSLRRFAGFVREWRKRFSFIVFDAAPIGVIPDAAAIGDMVDSYIIVVNAGSTNIKALQNRLDEFTQVKAKVAGFVLNRADMNEALLYHRSYSRYHRKKLG